VLALNNYDYAIEAAPRWIDEDEKEVVAADLSALLQRPIAELREILAGDAAWASISRRVPRELGKEIMLRGLPGIYANNNRLAELTACLFNQLGIFHSGCTQDDTLYSSLKQLLYCFQLADATTQLDRN
jgi:hypothetical protein